MKQLYAFFALAIVILASKRWSACRHRFRTCLMHRRPRVVSFNGGGEVESFQAAARGQAYRPARCRQRALPLGLCNFCGRSAQPGLALPSKAKFGFHKGYVLDQPTAARPLPAREALYSVPLGGHPELGKKNGGFPTRGFNVMRAAAAKQIWHFSLSKDRPGRPAVPRTRSSRDIVGRTAARTGGAEAPRALRAHPIVAELNSSCRG